MGADGHIQIYDLEKIEQHSEWGKETVDAFLDHFLSSVMYRQKLQDKRYLTRYWGDNIYATDLYEVVLSCYNAETDKFNERLWSYDKWSAEYFMKLSKDTRQIYARMINYLEAECKLTEWEVWT